MKLLLLLIIYAIPLFCCAQTDNPATGAKAVGMGNASATNADAWALYNNVGALGEVEEMNALFAFDLRYGVVEFSTLSFGFVMPMSFGGVAGVSFSRFGDEIYNEQKIGLAYSHRISFMQVGAKVNYTQVAIDDQVGFVQGSRSALTFEVGGLATITPKLDFALHAYNLTQSTLRSETSEGDRLPVILKAGASYKPIEKLWLNAEVEKDIDYPALVKIGVNFEVIEKVSFRAGVNTNPFTNFFGIGFAPKRFSFDYALNTNTELGLSHHASLRYRFKPKKRNG
ncbi:MAG: type IX secretion system membrane protein PorP/SprF [Thermonemataceae bacterium]